MPRRVTLSGNPTPPYRAVVPTAADALRLDVFVTQYLQGATELRLSRARLQALIAAGAVQVDGVAPRRLASKVREGQVVEVALPAVAAARLRGVPMSLTILYEDRDLIVVAKPAGLVVHPGAGTQQQATLVHGLLAHCGDLSGIGGEARPGIVHRLDRGTSGVMVVAKHDAVHAHLTRQFAQRTVVKRYLAVVQGHPEPSAAHLRTPYGRHRAHRQKFTSRAEVMAQGRVREARTQYRTLRSGGGATLLEVRLDTGRTHQIRVHLADRGHPLLGDPLYGGRGRERLDTSLRPLVAAMNAQALHAQALAFDHPRLGTRLVFRAPLPSPFSALVDAIASLAQNPQPSAWSREDPGRGQGLGATAETDQAGPREHLCLDWVPANSSSSC